MEADWEVEIGGDAPVIEAHWPGFVDLHAFPGRINEIAEASELAPLADLLMALNAAGSPMWTAKCDVWHPEPGGLACYVDLLPLQGSVFSKWQQAEILCRGWIERLVPRTPFCEIQTGPRTIVNAVNETAPDATVTLVIRQAVSQLSQGFGVTAYFSAGSSGSLNATEAIGEAMVAFSNAVLDVDSRLGTDRI